MKYYTILGFLTLVRADEKENIIDKAVEITSKYYKSQFITSVVWAHNDSEIISDFLIKYPGTVAITPMFDGDNNVIFQMMEKIRYRQSVFFASKPEAFEKFMSLISKNVPFSIRLVLVYENTIRNILELSIFMSIAWKNGLSNIVIISKNYSDEIIISTYYPYSKGICGNVLPVKLNPHKNMFPNKFKNFNKCPIRLRALPFLPYININETKTENGIITGFGGYDGFVFAQIAHKLNATLDVNFGTPENSYGTYSEGVATGAIGDLFYNKADILVPAGVITLSRYPRFQVTHIYQSLDMRWMGPKRREIYHGLKLLLPFIDIVTPVLCLTFASFVIVALCIRRRTKSIQKKSICYQTFALLLGQTANYETNVTFLNIFFLIWIWFTFIIRIAYQGDLVQSLQNKLLETPFGTVEEAVTRVVGGGPETVLDYYRNTSLERHFIILGLQDIHRVLNRVADGEQFLIGTDTALIQRMRHSFQILESQITSSSACVYMRPGWPAAEMIDSIVVRLVESGIIEKIRTANNTEPQNPTNKDAIVRPLDMNMLCTCFYGLGVMSALCAAMLLMELIIQKYTYQYKHKRSLIKDNKP